MLIYCLPFFIFLWPIPGYNMAPSSSKARSNKEIDHTHLLFGNISNLYLSERFSDVVLVVDGVRLHAHRFLMASHNEYFSVLLYGGHRETYEEDVEINDAPVALFKRLLKYIYTGRINLSDFEGREIFELLKMSDFYGLSNLKLSLLNYLQKSIKLNDICSFLTMAQMYQFKELEVESLSLIENHPLEVLHMKDFLNLSPGALEEILNRDLFYAKELVIFHAVCGWINVNQDHLDRHTKIKVLSAVRYSLMSDEERSEAIESQLVNSDIISDAIRLRNMWSSDKPQVRGQLKHNEYFTFKSHRSPVTDVNCIHQSQGFSVRNNRFGTNMIKLDIPSLINFIEITLRDEREDDHQSFYSYYIEVSKDGLDWVRIVNHSNYNCRTFQRLWFHPLIVWYIHIVGTNSTADATFKVWDVRYNTEDMHKFEIIDGLIIPKDEYNVTSVINDAIVINGENSDIGSSLLDTYYEGHGRHDIYTYHLLGSEFIVVHLRQPYILSSMRMLLWGGDNQTYRYTIETSVDDLEWIMIVDKSKEESRSWQMLQFKPTLTLYIRITGVYSSVDNVFRCVYLEAPVQATSDSDDDEYYLSDNNETDSVTAETSD